jgi:hypothetical protein
LWSKEERKRLEKIIASTDAREQLPPSRISWGAITINIISTEKDLELLNQVIEFSYYALTNFSISSIRIIVPEDQISKFEIESNRLNLSTPIHVIGENQLIHSEIGKGIFQDKFPTRTNWCYQQFLKVESVLTSETQFALIVDCDTLLLNPRAWLNNEASSCVMPTFEYQPQYENLLSELGMRILDSQYSFVPHHMLYKVEYLRKVLNELGINNVFELAKKVEELSDNQYSSPFCIDYSLYGHSVYSANGPSGLIRWANLEVPRRLAHLYTRDSIWSLLTSKLFNSISFHSWKNS